MRFSRSGAYTRGAFAACSTVKVISRTDRQTDKLIWGGLGNLQFLQVKMDIPPLHESAAPFSSTPGSPAFIPPQLSIASCLTPDGFDMDKYRRYTAYRLARARGRSDAIHSTIFGGGESHATSVEQQSNNVFVKSCRSRCVLG